MLASPFTWWSQVDNGQVCEAWPRDLRCRREACSPWRCAVYQPHRTPTRRSQSGNSCKPLLDVIMHTEGSQLRGLCGDRNSTPCDVSTIIFEVPNVDFRLVIRPGKDSYVFRFLLCTDECEEHYCTPRSYDKPKLHGGYFDQLNFSLLGFGRPGPAPQKNHVRDFEEPLGEFIETLTRVGSNSRSKGGFKERREGLTVRRGWCREAIRLGA